MSCTGTGRAPSARCAVYATITEQHHVGCGFGRIELLADSTFRKLCARRPGTLTWRGFCAAA